MLGTQEERTEGMKREAANLISQAYQRGYKAGYKDAQESAKEEAYQRGLDDAWEVARKIVCSDGLELLELSQIFVDNYIADIFGSLSASEVIEKIRQYEEQKKAEEEKIKVGDRVRTTKERDSDGYEVFPVGTIGIIEEIGTMNSVPYKISANDDFWWYSIDMFEVIKDDEIMVGDEIVCGSSHAVVTYADETQWNGFLIDDSDKTRNGQGFTCMDYDGWKKTGRTFPQIAEVLKQLQEGE